MTNGYIQVKAINALRAARAYNQAIANHPAVPIETKQNANKFLTAFSCVPGDRLVLLSIDSPLIFHLPNENIVDQE
jgi:hypothetical protein